MQKRVRAEKLLVGLDYNTNIDKFIVVYGLLCLIFIFGLKLFDCPYQDVAAIEESFIFQSSH
jgi:hypothetical protein